MITENKRAVKKEEGTKKKRSKNKVQRMSMKRARRVNRI